MAASPGNRPRSATATPRNAGRVYVAIDTETTGIESDADEIIELAAVRFRLDFVPQRDPNGETRLRARMQELERWQSFVKPTIPIPYKIMQLTGIGADDVKGAPSFGQVSPQFRAFIGDSPLIGHSIDADLGFLARHKFYLNVPTFDTYELATLVMPHTQRTFSLAAIAEALQVKPEGAHRAMADTLVAAEVFTRLAERVLTLPPEVLTEIAGLTKRLATAPDSRNRGAWAMGGLFTDAANATTRGAEPVEPVAANNPFASAFGAALARAGSDEAEQTDLDLLYLLPGAKPTPLTPADDAHLQAADSALAIAGLSGNAATLAGEVADAINNGRLALIETVGSFGGDMDKGDGDDTGESGGDDGGAATLGYLAPAIDFATKNGMPVVVAAANEGLRARLLSQTLPELAAHWPGGVRYAEAKAQDNYLCLRRWQLLRHRAPDVELTAEEIKLMIKILVWLPATRTGDVSELRQVNSDRLWTRINSQKALCTAQTCGYQNRLPCFYFRALAEAEAAHIVVAEPGLLMADASGKGTALPPYTYAILDGAHQLEDDATRQLGWALTPNTLTEYLDWLSRPLDPASPATTRPAGLLHDYRALFTPKTPKADLAALVKQAADTVALVTEARRTTFVLLDALKTMLDRYNQEHGQGEGRMRLSQKERSSTEWGEVMGPWDSFREAWLRLNAALKDLRKATFGLLDHATDPDRLKLDLNNVVSVGGDIVVKLSLGLDDTQQYGRNPRADVYGSDVVLWLMPHPRTGAVSLNAAPLSVVGFLQERFFGLKRALVLTSPTLSVDGDFGFIRERLGLDQTDVAQSRVSFLPEPATATAADGTIVTHHDTLMLLPTDMPEPSATGYQKTLDQQIIELCQSAGGRALVVLTSNSAVRTAYRNVNRKFEEAHILTMAQGMDGSRRSMLERFKATPQTVMLTTLNFWETTDFGAFPAPADSDGGAFNLVVFAKLPFDAPNDPLFAARSETLDDAFTQYSLPRSILRFRQVFERLMRYRAPRTVVALMDSRLTRRSYGPMFVNSLPPARIEQESLSNLNSAVTGWLKPQL